MDAKKLEKLFRMLGTVSDHEALASLHAIKRHLGDEKGAWHKFVNQLVAVSFGVTASSTRPDPTGDNPWERYERENRTGFDSWAEDSIKRAREEALRKAAEQERQEAQRKAREEAHKKAEHKQSQQFQGATFQNILRAAIKDANSRGDFAEGQRLWSLLQNSYYESEEQTKAEERHRFYSNAKKPDRPAGGWYGDADNFKQSVDREAYERARQGNPESVFEEPDTRDRSKAFDQAMEGINDRLKKMQGK